MYSYLYQGLWLNIAVTITERITGTIAVIEKKNSIKRDILKSK